MLDAFIYDGLRSPFGRHAGALSPLRPDDLAAQVIKALLERNKFSASSVEDVLLGCTNQAGEDSRNVARHAWLAAGLPVETAAMTLNRLCASGLAAVIDAARTVACGHGDLIVAGGVESMTRAPFVMGKAESAFSREAQIFDTTLGARFPNPVIAQRHGSDTMPQTGDNVAKEFGISRDEADQFAAGSQAKYEAARERGFFEEEIVPVVLPPKGKVAGLTVTADEHPRPQSGLAALARLKPLAPGGIVTAGNASGINDGAAALLIGNRKIGELCGTKPLARVVTAAAAGVEPRIMGVGPVTACRKALSRAGLTLKDMDLIEINEAFASQVLACLRGLDLPFDDRRLNPQGGAIAVGHPLGASGARLVLTATRQLQRSGGRYALVSLCIGVGQGLAVILERV